MKIDTLKNLTAELEAKKKEICRLNEMAPQTHQDLQKVQAQCQQFSSDELLQALSRDANGNTEIDQQLRTLRILREKKELIPDCLNSLKADVLKLDQQIPEAVQVIMRGACNEAIAIRDAELAELQEKLLPRFGGDVSVTKYNVEKLRQDLPSYRWAEVFRSIHIRPDCPEHAAKELIREVERFEQWKRERALPTQQVA